MAPELIRRPPGTTAYASGPNDRYQGAFGFPSDSDPLKVYLISYDTAGGYWVCSCKSGIMRGRCKHLDRYDRHPTRAEVQRDQERQAIRAEEGAAAQARIKDRLAAAGLVRGAPRRGRPIFYEPGGSREPAGVEQGRGGAVAAQIGPSAGVPANPSAPFEPTPANAPALKLPAALLAEPPVRRRRAPGEV